MADPTIAEKAEEWQAVGEQLFLGIASALTKSDVSKFLVTNAADITGGILSVVLSLMAPVGIAVAKAIAKSEDLVAPALSEFAAAAASDMFGTDVPASAFETKRNRAGRTSAADALGKGIVEHIKGQAGDLKPGDEAANRYLGMVINMALEGWYQGWMFEWMTSMIPKLEIGQIESFSQLDDTLAQALGLGRLSRRVLSPLIDTVCVKPFDWELNKVYRPTLLSPSTVARQWARNRWSWDDVVEELARQGYSDARIDALINEQQKFLSPADVRQFVTRGEWTSQQGIQHLQDQGYDQDAAERAMRVEGLKRIEQHETTIASALVSAYVSRDITDAEFGAFVNAAIGPPAERALLTELARTKRALNVKRLSPPQAEACVKAGILSVVDYRRALEREGYDDESVTALELLLRWELDAQRDLEKARADAAAARAAEQQAKDAAAAKRRAEIDADRARTRRASLSNLERAVVRGLVPIARYEDVLRAQYDPEAVSLMVGLVEDDRQRYLADQARRAEALKRAGLRDLNVGELEHAVLTNLLTIAEFRTRLGQLGFDAADADLLARMLAARKRDLDAAQATRGQAGAVAATRAIDLGRFEQLVRRGARTLAQYDALLSSLGFDDAARAAMTELLGLKIADDQAAAGVRADAEPGLQAKGLSLEQFRRAVLLGTKTVDEFQTFLIDQGFTADAQIVLLADLRNAVDEAEAARQRRAQAAPLVGARELPLATVARAARLGIISPAVYQARLERDGYTPEDVDVEMQLLLTEIAAVQADRARRDAIEQELQAKGLSLAQLARAVKAGVSSLEDYRARALTLGYSAADVDILVRVLADDLAETASAKARRTEIESGLQARDVVLAVLEDQVRSGAATIDDYRATLEQLGLSADDADLLAFLLSDELEAAAAG